MSYIVTITSFFSSLQCEVSSNKLAASENSSTAIVSTNFYFLQNKKYIGLEYFNRKAWAFRRLSVASVNPLLYKNFW